MIVGSCNTYQNSIDELFASVITVPVMSRNEHGDRIYDKGHVCYFCNTRVSKMARHILSAHKNEPDVIKIEAIPTDSSENRKRRARELDRIRWKGDFYHNLKVLKSGGKFASYPGGIPDCKKVQIFT